jgi:hypothetical protein
MVFFCFGKSFLVKLEIRFKDFLSRNYPPSRNRLGLFMQDFGIPIKYGRSKPFRFTNTTEPMKLVNMPRHFLGTAGPF